MKILKYFLFFSLLFLSFIAITCQKDFSLLFSVLNDNSERGLVAVSGCKHFDLSKSLDDVDKEIDRITYRYQNGVLELNHINTAFNCCPDTVGADVVTSEDQIEITEYEILENGGCRCLCLFNLGYKISNLESKTYEFILHQNYVPDTAAVHHYFINFADSAQGSFTIPRFNYPWGI